MMLAPPVQKRLLLGIADSSQLGLPICSARAHRLRLQHLSKSTSRLGQLCKETHTERRFVQLPKPCFGRFPMHSVCIFICICTYAGPCNRNMKDDGFGGSRLHPTPHFSAYELVSR